MNAALHDTFRTRYPDLWNGPASIEPYISPDYFEREKRHVFKKVWNHIGRVNELPKVGDYIVKELPACDATIIVVRGKDEKIRAFHNVCSHRLNKICYGESGSTRKFFCKFHGWAFDLEGALVQVPDEDCFDKLDRSKNGLTPVHCDIWEGFIFVNVDLQPKMTLKEYLQPMFSGLEGYPFAAMTSCYSWQAVVKCNWKLALDAFQETYHVSYVHGRSIAEAILKTESGGLKPLDGLCGEFHRRLSVAGNQKSVYGNPKLVNSNSDVTNVGGNRPIAAAALRHGQGGTKFATAPEQLPEGLNWTRNANWIFDINVIFPDFYLSVRPNYFQAYNFRPLTHDTYLFDARVYYPEMTTPGGRFYQEYMKVALRDVLLEDLSTLEHNQAAMATRAKPHMILQDYEVMVRHQVAVIDRMIADGESGGSRS